MTGAWIDMHKYETLLAAEAGHDERPADAVEWSLDVLRWLGTNPGADTILRHVELYAGEKYDTVPGVPSTFQDVAKAGYVIAAIRECLDGATIYVTGRMVHLACQIAEDVPDLPLSAEDLPATHGVFWLQEPFPMFEYVKGVDHAGIPARMIGWRPTDVRVLTPDDDGTGQDIGPGLEMFVIGRGHEVGVAVDRPDFGDDGHRWMPLESTGWRFDLPWRRLTDDEVDALPEGTWPPPGTCIPELAWLRRFVWALCVLVSQEVASASEARLDRPTRRRAERAMPRFSGVRVVRLRRLYDPNVTLTDEERAERVRLDRHWAGRWRVREHWAWRACGPGRSQRRRVLIRSYVKGPEDLPLIEKPTVYSLER